MPYAIPIPKLRLLLVTALLCCPAPLIAATSAAAFTRAQAG
jgi:hypothetical protein